MNQKNEWLEVRKATPEDVEDFVALFLISSPYYFRLFGEKIRTALYNMFKAERNLFSYQHVIFAELDGKNAGMLLGYPYDVKARENLRTGLLWLKYSGFKFLSTLPLLLRFNTTVGKLGKFEYYISNLATFEKFRGKGVRTVLIMKAEEEAKLLKAERIVLDVEQENTLAINFYERLGFEKVAEFYIPIRGKGVLSFYRMGKRL
jgi:ribosomal protein S18 acetylase RimI-like enzyme